MILEELEDKYNRLEHQKPDKKLIERGAASSPGRETTG